MLLGNHKGVLQVRSVKIENQIFFNFKGQWYNMVDGFPVYMTSWSTSKSPKAMNHFAEQCYTESGRKVSGPFFI